MQFGLLGPVQVRDGDRLVKIGGPQQQRLLAVLLSQPDQVVETHRLVDALWPDGLAPDGAGHSVLTYVHRLRGAIGNDAIVTHGAGYVFPRAAGTLDVEEFESLLAGARAAGPDAAIRFYDRALALWRGRAYGAFREEWWALAAATRLDELRVVAGEERAVNLITMGDRARAIPELQALAVAAPLRERPVRLLAQALHATGRQAEALREITAFRARLGDETGLEPSPELVELERAIAIGDEQSGPAVSGRPLRGYVLHEAIGEGASGRVYAATQPGTQRLVAIKSIRPELADTDEFVRRFDAEAKLVARLEHPHIVPLYDYWREPGGAYLVFRMLATSASASVIVGGPWSLTHTNQLVEEVGSALLTAHASGVVHRDVRAANVLLDEAGNTYLTDFGIALSGERADRAGIENDIRDFAVMLRELLNGAPTSRKLAGRVAGVPDAVDDVLAAATRLNPAFESMADVILAWRAALGRSAGVVTPMSPTPSESVRRRAVRELVSMASAGVNPYQGLRAFGEGDAAVFFGREKVVDKLEAAVRAERFVAVIGPSGSGKSSVVAAGLVPRLRADDGSVIATMVPGEHPLTALRDALTEVATEPLRARSAPTAIAAVARSAPGGLVLIVDQFEECWTRTDAAERDDFLAALAQVVGSDASVPVRIVVTARADFYDKPLQHAAIGALVSEHAFALPPMAPAELEDAVVLPAARAGVTFDEGVVTALVADAAAHPGTLPILQFTLAELYERRVDGRIGAAALHALGGIAGAVGHRAEDVYEQLDDAGKAGARELFARLVTPGEGTADTRRRARIGELSAEGSAVADRFVAARLLVSDREVESREPVVEVAHEALLSRWPRLHGWVDDDRRWIAQLQHLAAAARTWDGADRPDGDLYRGSRLEAAIEALPEHESELAPVERAFVDAGRTRRDAELDRERRSTRRLRRLLVVVALALVVALIAGLVAVDQRGQARRDRDLARTRERQTALRALVDSSVNQRATKRDLAALLAIEAYQLAPGPATEGALLDTFTGSVGYERAVPVPGGNSVLGVPLPIGHTYAALDDTGAVHLVDLNTGTDQGTLAALRSTDVGDVYLDASANGRYLAVGSDDINVPALFTVWDLKTRKPRFPARAADFDYSSMAISPDGSLLAFAGGTDARVEVRSAVTGALVRTFPSLPIPPGATYQFNTVAVRFLPRGDVAVGSQNGTVRILDPRTGAEQRRLTGATESSEVVISVSSDGRTLVASGAHATEAWDLGSGQLEWKRSAPGECNSLAIAMLAGAVLCPTDGGRVNTFDLATGAVLPARYDYQLGYVSAVSVTADGTQLIEAGGPSLAVWRLDGGGPVSRRLLRGPRLVPQGFDENNDLIVSRAPSEALDTKPVLVDGRTGKVIDPLPGVLYAAATPDPNRLFALFTENTGGFYDVKAHRRLPGAVIRLPFDLASTTRAGNTLVATSGGENGAVQSIDLRSGDLVSPKVTDDNGIYAAFADSSVRHVFTLENDGVVPRGADGERLGAALPDSEGASVAVGDRDLVVVTQEGRVNVLNVATGRPDGADLPSITGGVLDPPASGVLLSRDGLRLMLAGADGRLRIADMTTRQLIGEPIEMGIGRESGAVFSADGNHVAFHDDDGVVEWDLDPATLERAACQVASRNLTRAEWTANIGTLAPYRRICPAFPTER